MDVAPRKRYLPTLPVTECTADGKIVGTVLTGFKDSSHRLKQHISPLQQLVMEEANRALNDIDPMEALEKMVCMPGCHNKTEKMALIRMHLLTLLSYKQISPEKCV